jgi:phosphohistidine swiveling domain-containing protein
MNKLANNKYINLTGYQIIPEASRSSYFSFTEVVANYCWQKHNLFPINTLTIVEYKDNKFRIYYAIKDRKHFLKVVDKFAKSPKFLIALEKYLTNVSERAVKHIDSFDTCSLNNKDLSALISFYYLQTQELHKPAMVLRLIDRGALEHFKNLFLRLKIEDKSGVLSAASRQSFSTQENVAMLTLARKVSVKKIKIKSDIYKLELKNIYNKFCWSTLGYYDEPLATIASYEKRMNGLIKNNPAKVLQKIKNDFIKEQKERQLILKGLSKHEKAIAAVAGEASYLKDYFKFSTNKLQLSGEKIFQEISRRTSVEVGVIKNLSHADAAQLALTGVYDKKAASKYQKHAVFVSLTGKIKIRYDGAVADNYEKKFLSHIENLTGEFKGRIACMGVVSGKAKIVHSPKDFHKINKGDILVVMNTGPDFVPILPRVGAIVAEEGGITAHVSVISREMKIPCVVGIPHVSREIKDGDLLEVDADKGIVKILKRAK